MVETSSPASQGLQRHRLATRDPVRLWTTLKGLDVKATPRPLFSQVFAQFEITFCGQIPSITVRDGVELLRPMTGADGEYEFVRVYAVLLVSCVLAAFPAAGGTLEELTAEIAKSRKDYDLAAAEAVLERLWAFLEQTPSEEGRIALVRAALNVAELNRMDYEQGDLRPIQKRRLGKVIDAAAKKGHETLERMPESSEKYRMMADLWGTMIRSNYQGKKYAKKMDQAQERALELDPLNPNAHVTACKRKLFAEENRGGDLPKALEHLNRALELNPECEPALILRGIAHEKNDALDLAVNDWRRALELNPNCRPAQDNLDRVMAEKSVAE